MKWIFFEHKNQRIQSIFPPLINASTSRNAKKPKYVGFVFQNHGCWSVHISYFWKGIYLLRKGNTYFTWRMASICVANLKKLFLEFLVLTVFHFQPRIFPFRLINKKVLTTISARCSFFVKLKLFWKKVAVLRMARFGFLNDIFSKLFLTLKKTAYTQTKKSFIWLIYLNKVTKEKRVYSNNSTSARPTEVL